MSLRHPSRLVVLVALTISVTGCGGSNDTDQGESVTTASTATATRPATTTAPSPMPNPTTITIQVVDGKPQGGIARPSVEHDQRVLLVVKSDTADEVHLHGYDLSADIVAGGTVRLGFTATIRGRFEVELEQSGVQIAELTVR